MGIRFGPPHLWALLIVALLLAACGHNQVAQLPAPAEPPLLYDSAEMGPSWLGGDPRTVSRYANIGGPEYVQPSQRFDVSFQLGIEASSLDAQVVAIDAAPDQEDFLFQVVAAVRGAEIVGGKETLEISMKRSEDSERAVFTLDVNEAATRLGQVELTFAVLNEGRLVGHVEHEIRLDDQIKTIAEAESHSEPLIMSPVGVEPDLTVFRLNGFVILSSRKFTTPAVSQAVDFETNIESWLDERLEGLAGPGRGTLLRPGSPEPTTFAKGVGRELYARFTSPAFKEVFWFLEDLDRSDDEFEFETIQVITDQSVFPWELLRPYRTGTNKDQLDFLGLSFRIARRQTDETRGLQNRASPVLKFGEIEIVQPTYGGNLALEWPAKEAEWIGGLTIPRVNPPRGGRRNDFIQVFHTPPEGVIHFAGHGVYDAPGSVARFAIQMEDGPLTLEEWHGEAPLEIEGQPFIFFNACDLGQSRRSTGFIDGWATAFLERGASGFIGALWPVNDEAAARFAKRFYESLDEHLLRKEHHPIADALMEARKLYEEEGNPTYLAYVLYGDADAHFITPALAESGY